MATNINPQPAVPPPATLAPGSHEVRVVSHSNIFYWWPVWAVGLIMFLWTWFIDGHLMVTVPSRGTEIISGERVTVEVDGKPKTFEKGADLVATSRGGLPRTDSKTQDQPDPPSRWRHMAANKNLGVIYCMTLLLVIVITNVPLRGMWSVVVIITIVLVSVILALAGMWEYIVNKLNILDIRINAGGYLFISIVLFVIWLVALVAFDRQTYIVFTPGQFKVCQSIGDGEKVYDTMGLQLEKVKGDFFRHYILGLGSGDLVVRTTGAQAHHFDLPNVLFINRKVQLIENMLREKKVTVN